MTETKQVAQDPVLYAKKIASKEVYLPKEIRDKYVSVATKDGFSLKKINGSSKK